MEIKKGNKIIMSELVIHVSNTKCTLWTKTVCILLEQIKRGNLMVCWVVCHLPLVRSPLWCHFITFTCSLFNQLSQSSRALWSEYKAIKLILGSDPIHVDPFLTLLLSPKATRLWKWGFGDERGRLELLLQRLYRERSSYKVSGLSW